MTAVATLLAASVACAQGGEDAFRATLAVKSPGVFGTPAASTRSVFGSARQTSASSSMNAILAVKDPQRFGPRSAAADIPAMFSHTPCRPGSFEAIMSAKLASWNARPGYDSHSSCS